MAAILVFVGSGLGGLLRYGLSMVAVRWLGAGFPWGTLFINIAGSFAIGAVAELWTQRPGLPWLGRLFLTTGIMGGFTTFSAFSLETVLLWQRGEFLAAILYVSASLILSIAALAGGLALMRLHP